MTATIFEAKTKLSELIRKVQQGETVTITSGRAKKPVAMLGPAPEADATRKIAMHNRKYKSKRLGALEHLKLHIPPEAFAPLTDAEMREYFGDAFE